MTSMWQLPITEQLMIMKMKSFGAQYVVYEDSGFLMESVLRTYPLVKKIVFLVGAEPWNGTGDRGFVVDTINKILMLPDPEKKFIIVSKHWESETATRNEGLDILKAAGCEWCLTIDDDEMYNRADLRHAMEIISNWVCANGEVGLWMVSHLIYWKNRATVIQNLTSAMPVFVRTDRNLAFFSENRCVAVNGVWMVLPPHDLVMHHLSYVRPDDRMKRKMSTFSHAGQETGDWYETVWKNWTPDMENLHPNPKERNTFTRAVPAVSMPYRLEPWPTSLT